MSVYHFTDAILRAPAQSVVSGLRDGGGDDPAYSGVKAEHAAYAAALRASGVNVVILPALEEFPDSVFVEDPALVFPEGAIILRPGAESRFGEAAAIEPALREAFTTVLAMTGPGFADGGDILLTPQGVMIGLSARTNRAGAEELSGLLAKLGRKSLIVETPPGVLHFKTDCSLLDDETVLATERLAAAGFFDGFDVVTTPPGEEAAANALRINDVVFIGATFPRTAELLTKLGYTVVPLSTMEIGKIDAGLSCMSLRWKAPD